MCEALKMCLRMCLILTHIRDKSCLILRHIVDKAHLILRHILLRHHILQTCLKNWDKKCVSDCALSSDTFFRVKQVFVV